VSSAKKAPKWRRVIDRVDRSVTPRANAVVRTSTFADLVAAQIRLEGQLRRRMERQMSAIWHLLNLPTVSDHRRLRAKLVAIEAQLEELNERLAERAEDGGEADGSGAGGEN
jgi:hypothetical protein